jgi:hypothetical protein
MMMMMMGGGKEKKEQQHVLWSFKGWLNLGHVIYCLQLKSSQVQIYILLWRFQLHTKGASMEQLNVIGKKKKRTRGDFGQKTKTELLELGFGCAVRNGTWGQWGEVVGRWV